MSHTMKFRHHPFLCRWCFESLPKNLKDYCSSFCKEEATKWKEYDDKLVSGQKLARRDIQRKRNNIENNLENL